MGRSCRKTLGPYQVVVSAYDTTANFEPLTGWMPLMGIGAVDFAMDVRNLAGNLNVKPGYQVATVRTTRPDSATGASTYVATDSISHVRESLSTEEGAEMWVRFGLLYKNSSGSSLGRAEVQLTVNAHPEGEVVGSPTLQINPTTNNGEVSYHAIGGCVPTIDLSEVMAAVLVEDKSGSLETQLAIRTATDRDEPNPWTNLEGGWNSPSTGNSGRLVAALDPDTVLSGGAQAASNMWFQLGLGVQKTGRATIHVVGAASRS